MKKHELHFKKEKQGQEERRSSNPLWQRGIAIFLSAALVVTSVFTIAPNAEKEAHAASGSDWATPFMRNLVDRGVLKGDLDGTLNPSRNVTRAEFAAMLNRAFGFKAKGTGKSFSDVDGDAWYQNDIQVASYQGYFAGNGNGMANPSGSLTREEAVVMICRALKIEELSTDPLQFTDSENFRNWSRGYINAAAQKGMLSGYSDKTFKPQNRITRGEVSKMLSDVAGEIVKTPSQVSLGYVSGNVTLAESGAGLRNTTISGDLYITEGVGLGYVYLDNVTVLGDVIISGAGQSNKGDSSIIADDCTFENVIVDVGHGKTLSMIAEGNTVIDNTVIKSNAYLEENNTRKSAFKDVQLKGPDNTRLDLSGEFEKVRIMSAKNALYLGKGYIDQLTVDEYGPDSTVFIEKGARVEELFADIGTKITGKGEIGSIIITANGTTVEQRPENITIRPGITATIDGEKMGSTEADQSNQTPKISSGYPEVEDVTANSAKSLVKVNKPGKIYWMVLERNQPTPSEEELKSPTKVKAAIASGNSSVTDADKEIQSTLGSLKSGIEYEVYAMLEDAKGDLSRIKSTDFMTIDNIAPKFVQSYPQAEALYELPAAGTTGPGIHKIKISAVPTKDVELYWALMKKGAPAVTNTTLITKNVPGSLATGQESGTMDIMKEFFIQDGLVENTEYDIYICAKDKSGNLSTASKLTVKTQDVTPPDFQRGYPRMGPIDTTAVTMEYETTETSKLYWMVYQENASFPPNAIDPGTTEGGIDNVLNSEEAKRAVINGNGSYQGKKGTTNTVINQYGTFQISGLAAQTAYDLYIVLQDAAGNTSAVTKIKITTKDDMPPSAKMVFDGVGAGSQPAVGSNIRIEFSETVYGVSYNNSGAVTKRELLSTKSAVEMPNYVRLYDISNSEPVEVPIDFSNVLFLDNGGKTVMVFSSADTSSTSGSAVTGAALKLKSGNRYRFELMDISDFSGNAMPRSDLNTALNKYVYRMAEFVTQAPYIKLKEASVTGVSSAAVARFNTGFEIEPKIKNAADTLCFDIVLESDHDIKFIVSARKEGGQIVDLNTTDNAITVEKGKYYLLNKELLKPIWDPDEYLNKTKFNELEKTQYYIKLVSVDDNTDSNSWNGKVTVTARGVAGEPNDMNALAFLGVDISADHPKIDFDKDIISAGMNAKQVSDPAKLSLPVYFTDSVAPAFVTKPAFTTADITIKVDVKLDKPGTVYWLLAPKGRVSPAPTAAQLESFAVKPEGGKYGKIDVTDNVAYFSATIKDLLANQEYDFFYVAKGVNASSEVGTEVVMTKPAAKPRFADGFPNSRATGADSVLIRTTMLDASALVAWAVFPAGTQFSTADGLPSVTDITSAQPGISTGVAAAGKEVIPMGVPYEFTVKGLKTGDYYDFYAIAINSLLADQAVNDSNWTSVAAIKMISPNDLSAPKISFSDTTITNVPSPPGIRPLMSGTFSVKFSEPLYYRDTAAEVSRPLTSNVLKSKLAGGNCQIVLKSVDTISVDGQQVVTGFTVSFTGAGAGSTIAASSLDIWDKTNRAGTIIYFKLKNGTAAEGFYDSAFEAVKMTN